MSRLRRREIQDRNKALGRVCLIDGCETGVFASGLCGYHYRKEGIEARAERGDVCSVSGCAGGRVARGLCRKHLDAARARERKDDRATSAADGGSV